jgi:RHS repeat-associated protein
MNTNHLGNVLTTISDRKKRLPGTIPAFEAVIETAQDYYPFGSLMPGRKYNAGEYRFGFNGQEKDDEITGVTGSHTTALFWEYDTRLGRRWNLDPKPNHTISNYATFTNNPIWFTDVLGDTVRYSSLKDRVNVGIGKMFSKDYKKEVQGLEASLDVFEFKKVKQGSIGGNDHGQIELLSQRKDDVGNVTSNVFQIQYEKSDPTYGDGVGRSPYHGLFEETFHAGDYDQNRSTSGLTKPDGTGRVFIGHAAGDRNHEARAWNFAANNAPFAPQIVKSTAGDIEYRVITPLIQQIRELNSNPNNPNPQIAKWLYEGPRWRELVARASPAGASL